jgi:peptidoglycan glycosyltransferase
VEQFQITEPLIFDGITTRAGNFDIEDAAKVQIAWSGIGQHLDLVNPARFMAFMGAVAAGGEAAMPYVISNVSNNGKITYDAETETSGQIMSTRTAQLLTDLMRNNVTQIYGDGYFPGLSVCAKSGTAEVGGGELPNATFAGFVADEAYPLAFVCMVENAGAGSEVCVPIISKVLTGCKNLLDAE